MIKKTGGIILLTIGFLFMAYLSKAEEFSLMTYYPVPAGSFLYIRIGAEGFEYTLENDTPGNFHRSYGCGLYKIKFSYDNTAKSPYETITNSGIGINTEDPNAALQVIGAISRTGTTLNGAATNTHVNLGADSISNDMGTTVGGGGTNIVCGDYSTIGGGTSNAIGSVGSTSVFNKCTISGGGGNIIQSSVANLNLEDSTISGGAGNKIDSKGCTIDGGEGNTIISDKGSRECSTIGGGSGNIIGDSAEGAETSNQKYCTIAGGSGNKIYDSFGTIGGGGSNVVGTSSNGGGDTHATVAGGLGNTAGGQYNTVGGGRGNTAGSSSFKYVTVGGGYNNNALGESAVITGGQDNSTSGICSTVCGGKSNSALGMYSWAGGYDAEASQDGTFVWAGTGTTGSYTAPAAYTFNIYASGGAYLNGGGDRWSDVAEFIDVIKEEDVKEGDIVSVKAPTALGKSTKAYDDMLIGVVSSKKTCTFHLGDNKPKSDDTVRLPIALAGVVYVKVNNESGPIKIGDAITSSSASGVGMKAVKPGKIVGYAMEERDFKDKDTGEIIIFASIGYYLPKDILDKLERLE